MEIIRGKIKAAKKVVIYGPEGIGKSTFASRFPDPVFIDTEGSTSAMDVARLPKASSWQMVLDQVSHIKMHPEICRTLVIDTIDWAEQKCVESICNKHQKQGIEDFGYGKGYIYVMEEFGRFLNRLTELVDTGIHVVLTAHAQIRKFEQPDELGAYDRYELKLGKKTSSQTSPLVKEWSDMLLFANYKTYAVTIDDKGKKHKAQGGKRVMYTSHHPCWDAKNRYGLPEELPFEYGAIAGIISDVGGERSLPPAGEPHFAENIRSEAGAGQNPENKEQDTVKSEQKQEKAEQDPAGKGNQMELPLEHQASTPDPRIPKALRDLMIADNVDEWDLQNVVEAKNYVPFGTPIWEYDQVNPGIVDGLLVASWDQVFAEIREMKKTEQIPFN